MPKRLKTQEKGNLKEKIDDQQDLSTQDNNEKVTNEKVTNEKLGLKNDNLKHLSFSNVGNFTIELTE